MIAAANYLLMVMISVVIAFSYATYSNDPHFAPTAVPEWTTWGEPDAIVTHHRWGESCAYWHIDNAPTKKHCWRIDG